jgi:hypothetical protein
MTLLRPSAQEMMMRRCGGFEGFGISIHPSGGVLAVGGKEGGTNRGGANQRIPATNWLINVGQTTTVLQVFTRQVDSENPIPACAALPGHRPIVALSLLSHPPCSVMHVHCMQRIVVRFLPHSYSSSGDPGSEPHPHPLLRLIWV